MLRTSEFWVGLATAVLGAVGTFLVQQKAVTPESWSVIQGFIISGITYVVARITSKFVKKV